MKKSIAILMILAMSVLFFCGCEEGIIYNPTVVIDETKEDDANTNSDSNTGDVEDDTNSDIDYEDVDLSDPLVIVGKWELVSHLVDDVEENADYKYLVITEDRKFYFTNSLTSRKSNLSETISTHVQTDYIYDFNFFTQNLETFSCLSFISNGNKIFPPCKINLIPYFKTPEIQKNKNDLKII